jgi:CheY-like chemotaxis protein
MKEDIPPNITILFVDDDPVFIEILQASMSHLNHEVLFSQSAEEALTIMKKQPVHIVVTDIRMPKMDGFELLKIIKQQYPYTPVVALTSNDDLKSATEFMRQGGSNYIKKFSDIEEFDMALNSAIKHWSVLDELRLSNETLTRKNKALKKTIRKQRETYFQLKKAKELAESAARSKSNLLANLSHELRTPLHGIESYIKFLKNDNQINASQNEKLDIINQCAEKMETLIDNSLSQLERIPVTLEDISRINDSGDNNKNDANNAQELLNLKDISKIGITPPIQDLYDMVQEGDIESIKKWCIKMKDCDDSKYDSLAKVILILSESFQISKIESILSRYFFKIN